MKRSEMIKELVKSLGAHDSWEKQCNYMLEVCEELGMIPPKRIISEEQWVTLDDATFKQGRRWHRSWEPE